ncbi:hypothetical protein COBT_000882 [Conglomerata obtusa]
MKSIIIFGIGYFLINWCVYSAHNYMYTIISNNTTLSPKKYSILEILLIIKLFGAFFWTNLADRTKKHKMILVIGLLGYAIFFSAFRYAPECMKAVQLNIFTIIYRSFSIFFLSAVYATMDAFVLEVLEQEGKERKNYGLIKMIGCLGHGFAHLVLRSVEKKYESLKGGYAAILLTIIVAVSCAAYIFISFSFLKLNKEVKIKSNDSFKKKVKKNFKYINELLTVNLFLFIGSITLQGIHRQSVATYLEDYYKKSGFNDADVKKVFAIRTAPEFVMYFATSYIDKFIGIYWMMFFSILFAIVRPLSYAYIHLENYTKSTADAWVIGLELMKGIFSALFGYSSSKLVKEISPEKTKSLAQGLVNGCYSGFAPAISGVLGYFLLGTDLIVFKGSDIRGIFLFTGGLGAFGLLLMIVLIFRNKKERKSVGLIYPEGVSDYKSAMSTNIN